MAAGGISAVGTEINMVDRLARENPDKTILSLGRTQCLCTTMYRIDPRHLLWVLEELNEDMQRHDGDTAGLPVPAEERHRAMIGVYYYEEPQDDD